MGLVIFWSFTLKNQTNAVYLRDVFALQGIKSLFHSNTIQRYWPGMNNTESLVAYSLFSGFLNQSSLGPR